MKRTAWNKGQKIQTNTGRTHFKKGDIPFNKGLPKEQNPLFGRKYTKEHKRKIGIANALALKGRKLSEATKTKISAFHKGHHRGGWKLTENTRRKMSESKKGSKTNFWKGGITPINIMIRSSLEYALVRDACFKRDNFTCIWCGQRGGKLNADHIKPFSLFPELRLALDNLRTLCEACHKKSDTYGSKVHNYHE